MKPLAFTDKLAESALTLFRPKTSLPHFTHVLQRGRRSRHTQARLLSKAQTLPEELLMLLFETCLEVIEDYSRVSKTLASCTLVCRSWHYASSIMLLKYARLRGRRSVVARILKPRPTPAIHAGIQLSHRLTAHMRQLYIERSCLDLVVLSQTLSQLKNLKVLSLDTVTFKPLQPDALPVPLQSPHLQMVRMRDAIWLKRRPKNPVPSMFDVLALFRSISHLTVSTWMNTEVQCPPLESSARVAVEELDLAYGLDLYWHILKDHIDLTSVHTLNISPSAYTIHAEEVIESLRANLQHCNISITVGSLAYWERYGPMFDATTLTGHSTLNSCSNLRTFTFRLDAILDHNGVLDACTTWRYWLSAVTSPALEYLSVSICTTLMPTGRWQAGIHDHDESMDVVLFKALDWTCLDKCVERSPELHTVHIHINMMAADLAPEDQPESRDPSDKRQEWDTYYAHLQDSIRSRLSKRTGALLQFTGS